jgi:hypothetical protein
MVPKLIKGRSFKGCASYLLNGSDGNQQDRVAFTETRNLHTEKADLAWRCMVATAKDAERLKQQAGIKNTGRKTDKHVIHLVLSFHPDEADHVDDGQMVQAADEALKALDAQGHQALIVAHNDKDHRHLHVLLNRTCPVSGRTLSSSNDRLRLSKWAQSWEERFGVFCEQRIVNNASREGEYIRDRGVPAGAGTVRVKNFRDGSYDKDAMDRRAQQATDKANPRRSRANRDILEAMERMSPCFDFSAHVEWREYATSDPVTGAILSYQIRFEWVLNIAPKGTEEEFCECIKNHPGGSKLLHDLITSDDLVRTTIDRDFENGLFDPRVFGEANVNTDPHTVKTNSGYEGRDPYKTGNNRQGNIDAILGHELMHAWDYLNEKDTWSKLEGNAWRAWFERRAVRMQNQIYEELTGDPGQRKRYSDTINVPNWDQPMWTDADCDCKAWYKNLSSGE